MKDKLGYHWYPKDWSCSDSVFELNLQERGLYRELIDMVMLEEGGVKIKINIWSRKFNCQEDDLRLHIERLEELDCIIIEDGYVFIPSCQRRIDLVIKARENGKKGGQAKAKKKQKSSESLAKSYPPLEKKSSESLPKRNKTKEKEIKTNQTKEEMIVVNSFEAINAILKKNRNNTVPSHKDDITMLNCIDELGITFPEAIQEFSDYFLEKIDSGQLVQDKSYRKPDGWVMAVFKSYWMSREDVNFGSGYISKSELEKARKYYRKYFPFDMPDTFDFDLKKAIQSCNVTIEKLEKIIEWQSSQDLIQPQYFIGNLKNIISRYDATQTVSE